MTLCSDGVTGFAHENDFFDLGEFEDFVEFGKILVIGLIAATDDEHEVVVWEGLNGDASTGRIGREIVVVIFDVFKLAEEF